MDTAEFLRRCEEAGREWAERARERMEIPQAFQKRMQARLAQEALRIPAFSIRANSFIGVAHITVLTEHLADAIAWQEFLARRYFTHDITLRKTSWHDPNFHYPSIYDVLTRGWVVKWIGTAF